jgi:cell division septum initiation protein DivIVA
MISKELKKLNRRELVDIIYQLKKNEELLQEQITSLEAELQDRRIRLSAAGSIAEAATDITGIFSIAQSTADLYLREVTSMKENAQKECDKMIEEAKKNVNTILADGKKQYDTLSAQYRADYKKWQQLRAKIKKAEAESDK